MAETDEGTVLRATLQSALEARAVELRAKPDALLPDIRRLLEVEAKLEPYYLDAHKGLVKELLTTLFCSDGSVEEEAEEDEDMADATGTETEAQTSSKISEGVGELVEEGEKKTVAGKEEVPSQLLSPFERKVEAAAWKRAAYARENANTLTLNGFRRLLEKDLKLREHDLDSCKRLIKQIVDQALQEEVPPARNQIKNGGIVKKPSKAEDVDVRPVGGKKRVLEDVKGKAVKKPVKRGRVESSDEDEGHEVRTRAAKGKVGKRAVEDVRSEGSSDGSDAEGRKEITQKRAKLLPGKGSSRPRSVSGSGEDDGDDRSSDRDAGKAVAKPRNSKKVEGEEGTESEGGSKKSLGKKAVNEQKPVYSKQVEHLRSVIKACGMNVSPSIYKKAKNAPSGKQEAVLVKELESMLKREGLTPQATEKEIKAVRRKKDKLKDLEGIDSSNIISESRGRRSTSASFYANKYSPARSDDKVDDEDDDEGNGNGNINDYDEDEDGENDDGSSMQDEEEEEEEDDEEDGESDGKGGEDSE